MRHDPPHFGQMNKDCMEPVSYIFIPLIPSTNAKKSLCKKDLSLTLSAINAHFRLELCASALVAKHTSVCCHILLVHTGSHNIKVLWVTIANGHHVGAGECNKVIICILCKLITKHPDHIGKNKQY